VSMLLAVAQILFWLSALALFYTYVGYALLVALLSRARPRPVKRAAEKFEPTVSIIITAYNEARCLAAKLENTLALDYPPEKLEIIVASDCSSDGTDDIARAFAQTTNGRVRLHRQDARQGKTAAQNEAVKVARGEIILFSDATTMYAPDVLHLMLPNFADERVGCVAGKLIYVDFSKSAIGHGARSYWEYETFLKRHESRVCSLIGASGCLYAVRKSAYVPLYPEACSDFIIATKMMEQGLRAVYEPAAVCIEETNRRADKEMRMRVRVIAQTYTDLWRHRHMLNPLRSGFYAVELVSHKVMRYLVPLFLATLFLTSLALTFASSRIDFYASAFIAQLVFYLLAFVSWMLERFGVENRLLAMPQYFVLANLASVLAAYKFARGERYAFWQPIRETALSSSDVSNAANAAHVGNAALSAENPPH
jgi:cellulose synthase/poly-beta-1,6-N-acetylglucosamine synthase-like glycosyltransferase